MGVFDNLDQVQSSSSGKHFQPGRFIAEIVDVRVNQGFKGTSFVVSSIVRGAQSDNPNAPKPGETAAHVWNASGDKAEMGRAMWKSFLAAAFGEEQVNAMTGAQLKELSEAVIDNDALKGVLMYVEVWLKDTRAGGAFTMHAWRRVATEEDLIEFGLA